MNNDNIMENVNNNLSISKYESENIKNLIYTIRGKQVMLDSDVAMLYNCETRIINQAVKRNIERFPERFCFQLTKNEFENLRSQIVILNKNIDNKDTTRKYLPYVFTEQGIAMLSGLLRNEIAVKVSISIMDAFIQMRKFITDNGQVFQEINNIKSRLLQHDKKFDEVFNELQRNSKNEFKQKIFFNGQIYDAYSLIIDIIKKQTKKF